MYFAVNDQKAQQKMKTALIEIPVKHYEIFKKISPMSEIYFPKNSIKKGVPTFVLKKLFQLHVLFFIKFQNNKFILFKAFKSV